MSLMCFQGESAAACSEKWLQNETIFSAVSSLFSGYLWKYSNTIIGTFFPLIAASPWKQLRALAPWVLILNTSWLREMGKMGKAWNLKPPSHLRDVGDVWVRVCYRDYRLHFIYISDLKEISSSKRNYQAADHTANLHIWSTTEKLFPSN